MQHVFFLQIFDFNLFNSCAICLFMHRLSRSEAIYWSCHLVISLMYNPMIRHCAMWSRGYWSSSDPGSFVERLYLKLHFLFLAVNLFSACCSVSSDFACSWPLRCSCFYFFLIFFFRKGKIKPLQKYCRSFFSIVLIMSMKLI